MSHSTSIHSQHQLRAKLEAMVLGDLLGPVGGESEGWGEPTVQYRYRFDVFALNHSAAARPAMVEAGLFAGDDDA